MQSQALSLDAAHREYVARQQEIRNMPQNYNLLPVPGSTANTVPPAPDSRTPGAINMSQPPTMQHQLPSLCHVPLLLPHILQTQVLSQEVL